MQDDSTPSPCFPRQSALIACGTCGTVRKQSFSNLARGWGKYCSVACSSAAKAAIPTPSHSTEYIIWAGIKKRCLNPADRSYPDYGGRGITICQRWSESFDAFLADVGSRPSASHSLDRIDNDQGYAPGNVRWATPTEQARNSRKNRSLTFQGQTRCISEWAEIMGVPDATLRARLRRGWAIERALGTPAELRD